MKFNIKTITIIFQFIKIYLFDIKLKFLFIKTTKKKCIKWPITGAPKWPITGAPRKKWPITGAPEKIEQKHKNMR